MKIHWRLYNPETDLEAVCVLHLEMERRVGKKLPMPDLADEPILATVVGVKEGKIVYALFLEVEMCAIGNEVIPVEEFVEAETYLVNLCHNLKIRMARAFVPKTLLNKVDEEPSAIQRTLEAAHFTRDNDSLAMFYRFFPTEGS